MPRKEAPLDVRIPTPAEERPVLSRVGIVAVLGFVLGVAWPKLLGAKLGPDAPGSRERTVAAAAAPDAPAPSAAPSAAASADDESSGSTRSNQQRAVLSSLTVARCRDAKGKKLEGKGDCAPVAAGRWIEPRVRSLAACPAAIGLEGDMQLEIDIDFAKKSLRVDQGAKSSFPTSTVRGVLKCAGAELETLELEKIAHTQPRVTLFAQVRFVPPGKELEVEPDAGASEAASGDAKGEAGLGTATVSWEKALLRDTPKDGKVVARVPQGARVKLLEKRDDWYLVSSAKGDQKGWVYRQAIGK